MKFHGVEGKWFSPVLLNWRFLLNFVLKPLRLDKKFFIFSIFKDAYLERIYGKEKLTPLVLTLGLIIYGCTASAGQNDKIDSDRTFTVHLYSPIIGDEDRAASTAPAIPDPISLQEEIPKFLLTLHQVIRVSTRWMIRRTL